MTKEAIIQKTIQALTILPTEKAEEISNFADYLLQKYEDHTLMQGIQILQSQLRLSIFSMMKKIFTHKLTSKRNYKGEKQV